VVAGKAEQLAGISGTWELSWEDKRVEEHLERGKAAGFELHRWFVPGFQLHRVSKI
jgi:hypothetical protein